MSNEPKGGFDDFLHSRAMLTPGIAGGLVTGITAALSGQFGLPVGSTALALSFFVALVVFGDKKVSALERLVLYVLNSLIVFSMSVGTNNIGASVTERPVDAASLASASPTTTTLPPPATVPTASTPAAVATLPTSLAAMRNPAAPTDTALFKPWFQEVARPTRPSRREAVHVERAHPSPTPE